MYFSLFWSWPTATFVISCKISWKLSLDLFLFLSNHCFSWNFFCFFLWSYLLLWSFLSWGFHIWNCVHTEVYFWKETLWILDLFLPTSVILIFPSLTSPFPLLNFRLKWLASVMTLGGQFTHMALHLSVLLSKTFWLSNNTDFLLQPHE